MDDWTVIITFNYGYEAHLAKSKLESEDIEVWLRDELNAQVCEAGPAAVGGVKLCVRQSDVVRSMHLLRKGGFINEPEEIESGFMTAVGKIASRIPLIRNLAPELVLLIMIAIIMILLMVPFITLNM